jgi:putative transcriptional regulator
MSEGTDNIVPGLLVAMPQMQDPNFNRTVILLLEHNEDGSFGVVVNNKIPAEVTIQLDEKETVPVVENVFLGGPVAPHVCMVIHRSAWQCERTQEIVKGLSVTEPSHAMPQLMDEGIDFRFIMGYAGWGPGQLESEMAHGTWLCCPLKADLVLQPSPDNQWEAVIQSLGIDPMMLVPATSLQ